MSKFTPPLLTAAMLLTLCLTPEAAQATNTRSFVSANGSDSANCARPTPCRTLAVALTNTTAGGEINMLDPAGYGTVTINKSISIVNDGVGSAGILVPSSATGITISAAATDIINLRGLIIEGAGVGSTGITFNTGKSLTIENCVIRNLTGEGIDFFATSAAELDVSNTLIANTNNGITIESFAAVNATFTRLEAYNNTHFGLGVSGLIAAGTKVIVTDSIAAGNGTAGFGVITTSNAASLLVVRSTAANNATGLSADGAAATLRVAQSTVTGNTSGWTVANSAVLRSYADSYIDGNTGNEAAPTSILKK